MKIIITGALGHIGSKLIRTLPCTFNHNEMILIDDLSSQRFSSLFELPEGKIKFIQTKVVNYDFSKILEPNDIVIHLAATTDAANSFNNGHEVKKNNFDSTQYIANACVEHNAKLIFPSSTSVYGSQSEIVNEKCSIDELQPQSPYAESKISEEQLILVLAEKFNLKACICRFGTIFGISQGMRFHTAVNKFCWQAVLGENLTVWETAYEQKRPYLYLNDAIAAITHIINNNLFCGEVYNILSNNYTVHQVIDCIKKHIPQLQIDFVKHKIMNQLSYDVCHNKFKNTGFDFNGNIEHGIKETIELLANCNLQGKINGKVQ